MHFRDSPDSLNGLGIPWNIWSRKFAVTYIYIYIMGRIHYARYSSVQYLTAIPLSGTRFFNFNKCNRLVRDGDVE